MARRRIVRILGWAAGRVPTLLVWAGLAGLFAYGATHGWKFGDDKKVAKKDEHDHDHPHDHADAGPFTPYFQPQPPSPSSAPPASATT